jgi:hypothetical protein
MNPLFTVSIYIREDLKGIRHTGSYMNIDIIFTLCSHQMMICNDIIPRGYEKKTAELIVMVMVATELDQADVIIF